MPQVYGTAGAKKTRRTVSRSRGNTSVMKKAASPIPVMKKAKSATKTPSRVAASKNFKRTGPPIKTGRRTAPGKRVY